MPLFGAIVAALVLHERLASLQVAGGTAILIGIAVASAQGTAAGPAVSAAGEGASRHGSGGAP